MGTHIDICLCCAPEDNKLREKLEQQLRLDERHGKISLWHSTNIGAGIGVDDEITKHLLSAHIIILLVSASFLSYTWYEHIINITMKRYNDKGDVHIIPVILRAVDWHATPFGNLQALPHNGKPVNNWRPLDDGLYDVADGIRGVLRELNAAAEPAPSISINEIAISQPLQEEEESSLSGNDWQDFVLVGTSLAHSAPVTCVIFTSDGDNYISDSIDQTIIVWNTHDQRKKADIKGHTDPIYSIALSHDMSTLASCGDEDTIKVWNVNTANFQSSYIHQTLKGHSGPIGSVALSPDRKILFSASDDGTIKIWDLQTGQVKRTLKEHSNAVCYVALSSDGSMLVSGSIDKMVGLWSGGGQFQKLFIGHSGPVRCVAVSSDNRTLASGSDDRTVKLWDLQTGQLRYTLVGHSGPIYSVTFSPDGSFLASGSADKSVKVWDPSTAQLLRTMIGHSDTVLCVAFHPSNRLIASSSSDNTIKIWKSKNTHNPNVPTPSGTASTVGMSAPSPLSPHQLHQNQKQRLKDGAISGSRLGAIIGPIIGIMLGAGLGGANFAGKEWWVGVGVASLGGLGIGIVGGALGVFLGKYFEHIGPRVRILMGTLIGALLGLIIGAIDTIFVLHIVFNYDSGLSSYILGGSIFFCGISGGIVGLRDTDNGDGIGSPVIGCCLGSMTGVILGWIIAGLITIFGQGWSLTLFPACIAGGLIGLLCNVLVSLAMRNIHLSHSITRWSFGATGAVTSMVGGSVLGCAFFVLNYQSGQMIFLDAIIGLVIGSLGVAVLGGIFGLIRAHLSR